MLLFRRISHSWKTNHYCKQKTKITRTKNIEIGKEGMSIGL